MTIRTITQDQALQVLDMLQHGILERVTVAGVDIIYSPHTNAWELSHTEYTAYDDIFECSEVLIALTL